jgi:hypothetical protein
MTKIALPGDTWALLRDPKAVTERQRRPVTRLAAGLHASGALKGIDAESGEGLTVEALDGMSDLNDAIVLALVAEWSFDLPITADGLLDLPGAVYDSLREQTAKFTTALLPDFSPSTDDESPSEPSPA